MLTVDLHAHTKSKILIFGQFFADDQCRKMPEVKDDATQTPMRPRVGPNVHFKSFSVLDKNVSCRLKI